jgi:hypothetical protein
MPLGNRRKKMNHAITNLVLGILFAIVASLWVVLHRPGGDVNAVVEGVNKMYAGLNARLIALEKKPTEVKP